MQPFTFFVSYRRQDTAPIALLLKHEIEKRLQFVRVSVDVEEMRIGAPFPDRLHQLIDEAHATIALIGKHWMPKSSTEPINRIGDDWVTHELEYSASAPLKHAEADNYGLTQRTILPLFADCEPHFDQFSLPESLAHLRFLHAERIDYASWPNAIGPLLDRIAVKLALRKRPEKDEYPMADLAKARTQPLGDRELAATGVGAG